MVSSGPKLVRLRGMDAVSPTRQPEDGQFDQALRPGAWEEYVGQGTVKRNLRMMIDAAQKRSEPMDHLLFAGPAGLGKTTLAFLAAKTFGAQVRLTSGPALERAGDLAALLTNLEEGDILFIDEIHRMNRAIEEVLYPAMESRKLPLIVGKGPSARSLVLDLPPFTLLGATTRENLLSHPLRTRFGAILRLDYYQPSEIQQIIERNAGLLNTSITPEAAAFLAGASRATPRVANRLLRRARDYADVLGKPAIDLEAATETLKMLDVDHRGLEPQDRMLLRTIAEKYRGGPVGIATLSAALSEDRGVIEEIYEPFLMSLGFLQRTTAGRVLLPPAYEHLGLENPDRGPLL
jgi:Holliday junction DNA helicase RuvB